MVEVRRDAERNGVLGSGDRSDGWPDPPAQYLLDLASHGPIPKLSLTANDWRWLFTEWPYPNESCGADRATNTERAGVDPKPPRITQAHTPAKAEEQSSKDSIGSSCMRKRLAIANRCT